MTPKTLPLNEASLVELRAFSRISLVVADLDGTLLTSEQQIADLIHDILPRLRHRGISFTIATGRTINGIRALLPRISTRVPLILYNGSIVVDAQLTSILHKETIPTLGAVTIARWATKHRLNTLVYPPPELHKGKLQDVPFGIKWSPSCDTAPEPNKIPISWNTLRHNATIPPSAAVLVDLRPQHAPTPVGLPRGPFTATKSGPNFIEFRPHSSNKGSALKALTRSIHVAPHEVLAIGDNDNDIELLRVASIGVAVGNASSNLRSVATYATDLTAAAGCIQTFRCLITAHRYRSLNPAKSTLR